LLFHARPFRHYYIIDYADIDDARRCHDVTLSILAAAADVD